MFTVLSAFSYFSIHIMDKVTDRINLSIHVTVQKRMFPCILYDVNTVTADAGKLIGDWLVDAGD